MDTLDREILSCLEQNSREKASVISRKINLSVSAVLERIRKMENAGDHGSWPGPRVFL